MCACVELFEYETVIDTKTGIGNNNGSEIEIMRMSKKERVYMILQSSELPFFFEFF